MSAPSVNKRQRTDRMGSAAVSDPIDYLSLIGSLPAQTLSNILLLAAKKHPDVATSIVVERVKIAIDEHFKTIDFDHYSKVAWKILNVKYSRSRSSQQFDRGFDAAFEVKDCIKAIGKATPAHSSYGTKKSALETLRKIGKSISLSGDQLGHEVIKVFQYEDCLESTMLRIAKRLTIVERNALMTQEFVDKLVELEKGSKNLLTESLRRTEEDEEDEDDEEEDREGNGEDDD